MSRKTKQSPEPRTDDNWAQNIGRPAYEAIAAMVAALQCDYDRLEELRAEHADLEEAAKEGDKAHQMQARAALRKWDEINGDELKALTYAAGDCESDEDARNRIEEDPLSLQVRSGWHSPGEPSEAEEFELLLGTGGPAVRIVGDLSNSEPSSPRLQVQDWFKPWTEYVPADNDVLMAYCQCFDFGD